MTCNIVFDFHSPHNNEYWYKCTHCDASDWFAYYDQPARDKPIKGCNLAYVPQLSELEDMTREQLIQEVVRLRKYNHKLQQFEERVYTIYPDVAVTLQEKTND